MLSSGLIFPDLYAIFKCMARLILALFLSSLGGTVVLHYLKNFLPQEKIKFRLDFDGLLERLAITPILLSLPSPWIFIVVVIALKSAYRFWILGTSPPTTQSHEPGNAPQKVLLKSELAFDLLSSPAFAILIGVAFK